MPFCKNCGNKISDQTKFCANCGTKVSQEESTSNSVPADIINHKNQKNIPTKKYGYLKYLLLLAVAVSTFFYFKGNSRNGYDSDGYKHGDWVEYINEDGSQEVPKESAKFIRYIKYSHGLSIGLVKDCYPNGNIQSEFELINGLYKKNQIRPADKYIGYFVTYDEQTSKIKFFAFYDENGKADPEKTVTIAFEKAKNSMWYDEEFFSRTEFGAAVLQYVKKTNQNSFENSSNTNDELPPMSSDNEFENSSGKSNNQANKHFHENNNNSYKKNISQKVTCYKCNGTGKTICSDCNGKGVAICGSCNGSGKYNAGDGLKTCYYCNGSKWVPCKRCYGKGTTGSCSECNGKGYNLQ